MAQVSAWAMLVHECAQSSRALARLVSVPRRRRYLGRASPKRPRGGGRRASRPCWSRCRGASSGAVALVSGRSIETLDALFEPLRVARRGSARRRAAQASASGAARAIATRRWRRARLALTAFVESHPGTLLEDKGRALALHFRLAPQFESSARQAVVRGRCAAAPGYHVQEGKMVLEIKPHGFTKATAIEEFMRSRPSPAERPCSSATISPIRRDFVSSRLWGGSRSRWGDRVQANGASTIPAAVRRWLALDRRLERRGLRGEPPPRLSRP
jgi:trehalose 6-phosphate phosphatase